ncbi:MAG TPA: hypothetical protein PLW55_03155 [Leptospiraceae bacterium]|nr:hypothetical protein [Leptospiraceae bacterium]
MRRNLFYAFSFLFCAGMILSRIWVTEDAYISFRAIENLYQGYGFVYNPGERVEVTSHPLWAAILIVLRSMGLSLPMTSAVLGLFFTGLAIYQLIKRSMHADAFPFAAIALCSISGFRDFSTSGLEFSLAFFLMTMFYIEVQEHGLLERPMYLAALLNLLYLDRPETALLYAYYSVFFVLDLWRSTPRLASKIIPAIQWGLPAILITGSYHAFRYLYFGALFANPYYAKAGLDTYYSHGLKYLAHSLIFAPAITFALLLAASFLVLHRLRSKQKPLVVGRAVRDLGAFALLTFYMIRVGGDFMAFRFWLPALAILFITVDRMFISVPRFPLPLLSSRPVWTDWGALLFFAALSFWPVPMTRGFIADERPAFFSIGAGSVFGSKDNAWAARGRAFRKLQDCLSYEDFWIANSQAHAHCLRGVGLGYVGVEAGPLVRIFDEQGLSDGSVARARVLMRFRPGHEHYTTLAQVVERGVLFCSSGEPGYDRVMATQAGIVIRPDPDLLATLPDARARMQELVRLKAEGSEFIPRLEKRYGVRVEDLLAQSSQWEADRLMQSKQACWKSFEGGPDTYFY